MEDKEMGGDEIIPNNMNVQHISACVDARTQTHTHARTPARPHARTPARPHVLLFMYK